jgi:cytochrome c biogenesis protein CcmG, thiol:disulfide interchange protein DsbE
MNWKMAAMAGAFVLPLLAILALGFNHDPHAVPSVLEGKPAPAFKLQTLDGKAMGLADLRGKPAVINFWATWCYPCKAEHNLLQDAAQYYGSKVQFLGVVYQDTLDDTKKYLSTRPNHYPHLMDIDSRVAIDFGVAGVPESFILNSQGQIVHKEAGVLNGEILRRYLDAMVKP